MANPEGVFVVKLRTVQLVADDTFDDVIPFPTIYYPTRAAAEEAAKELDLSDYESFEVIELQLG